MQKAVGTWFNYSADYRNLYLYYIFYLRRRLNKVDIDAETKLSQIEEIRSIFEQSQTFLIHSMYIN